MFDFRIRRTISIELDGASQHVEPLSLAIVLKLSDAGHEQLPVHCRLDMKTEFLDENNTVIDAAMLIQAAKNLDKPVL